MVQGIRWFGRVNGQEEKPILKNMKCKPQGKTQKKTKDEVEGLHHGELKRYGSDG